MNSIASGQTGYRALSGGYPDGPKPMYFNECPGSPGSPGKYLNKRKRNYHILGYIRLILLLKRFRQNTRFTRTYPDFAVKSITYAVRVARRARTYPDKTSYSISCPLRVLRHA